MEQLLAHLADMACRERAVASQKMANGMQLLAYPLEPGVLVGLGVQRDLAHAVRLETVLRRRSERLARFGAWLPALFADGSWYVVRRLAYTDPSSNGPLLSSDELMAAQELLE